MLLKGNVELKSHRHDVGKQGLVVFWGIVPDLVFTAQPEMGVFHPVPDMGIASFADHGGTQT